MNFILLFGRLSLPPPQSAWEHGDPGAGVVGGAAGVPGTGAAGLARVPLRGAGAAPSRSGGHSAVPQHLLRRARGKAAALPRRGDFEPPASSLPGDPVCAASGGGRALAYPCPVPPALVSSHFTSLAFQALTSLAGLSCGLTQAAAGTVCPLPSRELCNYFAGAGTGECPLPRISRSRAQGQSPQSGRACCHRKGCDSWAGKITSPSQWGRPWSLGFGCVFRSYS